MKEIEDNCKFGSMSAEACCSWPNSWRDIKGQLEMGCITPEESSKSSNNKVNYPPSDRFKKGKIFMVQLNTNFDPQMKRDNCKSI